VKVRYTPQAGRDLAEIYRYIASDNPAAAGRTLDRIERLAELLARVPFAGRRGRVSGTREMVVPDLPYIVVYRVRREAIEVVSVVHGARRR
jgi:addiction module RelE/StbE family toxin